MILSSHEIENYCVDLKMENFPTVNHDEAFLSDLAVAVILRT